MMHVVLSTAPSASATALATQLVERQLAACVNVIAGVTSVYRWNGAIQTEAEALLVIKTGADALPRLMAELPVAHTYEVPEIVALAVTAAHAPYAQWVDDESQAVK